jgi:hypothetical protein
MARGYLLPNHPQIIPDHPIRLLPKESTGEAVQHPKLVVENLAIAKRWVPPHVYPGKLKKRMIQIPKMIFDRSILRKCISVG